MARIRITDLDANSDLKLDPVRLNEIVGGALRPSSSDELLISFETGDVREPYVTGFLWNSDDRPPTSA